MFDYGKTKEDTNQALKVLLKGIQRVPSLLFNNPTQPLSEINLQDYTILDCEPLHDLKGHLSHLLSELPSKVNKALSGDIKMCFTYTWKERRRNGEEIIA